MGGSREGALCVFCSDLCYLPQLWILKLDLVHLLHHFLERHDDERAERKSRACPASKQTALFRTDCPRSHRGIKYRPSLIRLPTVDCDNRFIGQIGK